jgi:transcription elongation factor SPT6
MARKVEELMAHEKFKQGTEDDLRMFLSSLFLAGMANLLVRLILEELPCC